METVKNAIIGTDRKIRCPYAWCGKDNGIANKDAIIKDYIVRCRASRRGHEHYFLINWNGKKEATEND